MKYHLAMEVYRYQYLASQKVSVVRLESQDPDEIFDTQEH